MENLPFDLLPVLEANKDIKIDVLNKFGFQTLGRMNFLYPPFDNVKVRRAAFMAIKQKDVLDALVGNEKYQKICGAVFVCGTPLETDVGAESMAVQTRRELSYRSIRMAFGHSIRPIAKSKCSPII